MRMQESRTKRRPNLNKFIATLRRRVAQGDLSAMCDLGMWLQEGFQDRKGRSVLRRNPAMIFAELKYKHGIPRSSIGRPQLTRRRPCRCRGARPLA
jgi:hypothetical protein